MTQSIKDFIFTCTKYLILPEPVYEFGSLQVKGQEGFADLRPYFPNKEYIGCDMRSGIGVDRILNLHEIDLPNNTAGTVICLNTLEHTEYPLKAIREIYRIMKQQSTLIVSSPFNFQIHNHPEDYWRFTPEGMKSLLSIFDHSLIFAAGIENFPHNVVGVAFKGETPNLDKFKLSASGWQKKNKYERGWKGRVKMFLPPILTLAIQKRMEGNQN